MLENVLIWRVDLRVPQGGVMCTIQGTSSQNFSEREFFTVSSPKTNKDMRDGVSSLLPKRARGTMGRSAALAKLGGWGGGGVTPSAQ